MPWELAVKKVPVIVKYRDNSKRVEFLEFRLFMLSSNKINFFILKRNSLLEKRNLDSLIISSTRKTVRLRARRQWMAVHFGRHGHMLELTVENGDVI